MTNMPPRVDTPNPIDHKNVTMWTDEYIWGHRLYDQQSPWLLYLEFLSVAEANARRGDLLDERGTWYPLLYQAYKRMYLRNILFNNAEMTRISRQQEINDEEAWDRWIAWMNKHAMGVSTRDFSYLRRRFRSFRKFATLVGMLQGSAVESDTNRRWVSRFVFPFGPKGLYIDLGVGDGSNTQAQYINFGRTGELLYLMLCRCARRDELVEPVRQLFRGDNPWNRLLGHLQREADDIEFMERNHTYLPYKQHAAFDALGNDWLSIFELDLPGFDASSHLVTLGALHILLYQMAVASDWLHLDRLPFMVCEVVDTHRTQVRELSILSYQENMALPTRALEAYIDGIEQSEEWQLALRTPDAFVRCQQILQRRVWWPKKPSDYSGKQNPVSLLQQLRVEAAEKHQRHVAHVHRAYGRDIGLISKRGTNKLRYAPTDSFLKTLIAANVPRRMEFNELLEQLYKRYGLIFSEREAALALPSGEYDQDAFRSNAVRLEQRLGTLGMLRRLSDSCAYVENPMWRKSQ